MPERLDTSHATSNDVREHRIDRRTFFGFGAAAVLSAGGVVVAGRNILAQDDAETTGGAAACGTPSASPEASPAAGAMASPEASPAADACPTAGGDHVVHTVDIAFEPNEMTIPAGTDVVVSIENHGALQHDFYIDELGVESDLLDGGASTTVTINAEPGTYEYYCSVTGHKEAGMVGTLTVE